MKKYILTTGFFLSSLLGSLSAQGLQGVTLSANNSSPAASASSMIFPVVSPTCIYDQMTFRELVSAAFSSPSTRRVGIAALSLRRQNFNEDAIRLFLVGELCNI